MKAGEKRKRDEAPRKSAPFHDAKGPKKVVQPMKKPVAGLPSPAVKLTKKVAPPPKEESSEEESDSEEEEDMPPIKSSKLTTELNPINFSITYPLLDLHGFYVCAYWHNEFGHFPLLVGCVYCLVN